MACNYWKYCAILRFWASSEEDVENYLSQVSQVAFSKVIAVFVRAVVLSGASIGDDHKEDHARFRNMRQKSFLSASRIKVEQIKQTGRHVVVSIVQHI